MANYEHEENGKFAKRKELTPLQIQFMGELLTGKSKKQICEELGVARATVYNWFDTELWQEEWKKVNELYYKETLGDALKKLVSLMNCDDARSSLKATELILKLNGYLDNKLNITKNTTENFVITLVGNEEEVEENE